MLKCHPPSCMKLCASWLQVPRVAVQKRGLSRGGGDLWWTWWRKVRSSFPPLKGTWKGAHGSNPAEEGVETTDLAYFFTFKMLFMCIEIYNNVCICVLFCLLAVVAHISGAQCDISVFHDPISSCLCLSQTLRPFFSSRLTWSNFLVSTSKRNHVAFSTTFPNQVSPQEGVPAFLPSSFPPWFLVLNLHKNEKLVKIFSLFSEKTGSDL